jgi:hypothetical protein
VTARGLYRGYWSGGKRAGQVRRLHIIREDGPKGWEPGKQVLCGQAAWPCRNSKPVILDPLPDRPPEGLEWCPKCIGLLAERLGLLQEVASSLAAYGLFLTGELWEKHGAEEEYHRALRREQLLGGQQ